MYIGLKSPDSRCHTKLVISTATNKPNLVINVNNYCRQLNSLTPTNYLPYLREVPGKTICYISLSGVLCSFKYFRYNVTLLWFWLLEFSGGSRIEERRRQPTRERCQSIIWQNVYRKPREGVRPFYPLRSATGVCMCSHSFFSLLPVIKIPLVCLTVYQQLLLL